MAWVRDFVLRQAEDAVRREQQDKITQLGCDKVVRCVICRRRRRIQTDIVQHTRSVEASPEHLLHLRLPAAAGRPDQPQETCVTLTASRHNAPITRCSCVAPNGASTVRELSTNGANAYWGVRPVAYMVVVLLHVLADLSSVVWGTLLRALALLRVLAVPVPRRLVSICGRRSHCARCADVCGMLAPRVGYESFVLGVRWNGFARQGAIRNQNLGAPEVDLHVREAPRT
jgi:hypothetical protein